MSKHNNSLKPSSHAKCKCGRHATIGEWKIGIGFNGVYECPDCFHHRHSKPISREDYYRSMGVKVN